MKFLIFAIIYIIIVWMSRVFFFDYLIPSKWVFRNRYWFQGLWSGIVVSMITLLPWFNDAKLINLIWFFKFLVFIVIMMLFNFISEKLIYKKLCKNIKFEKEEEEDEIMSDSGILMNEGERTKGRLILTTKRLCFLGKDNTSVKLNII